MVRDMTEGRPLRLILSFCIPLLLGNIFQQMYNMVDSIIVGRTLGPEMLAAVGSTGSLNFLVIGFVSGICSGFCIHVAQRFGAGDYSGMRRYVANAVYLCIGFTVVLTALTMLYTRPILVLMRTPDDIIDGAYSYIIVIFAGIAATMLYNMLAGILRSLGDSRTPLIFLIIASVLNVILDFIFILVFNSGVAGAGYATVISQLVSAVLCLIYIGKKYPILRFEPGETAFDGRACLRLMGIGVPMALQFSITAVGSIILQSAVNTLGTAVVAAVTAANKIQLFMIQPMESVGITMATYCGQNLGAQKLDRIEKGIKQSLITAMIYCCFACAVVWLFGRSIGLLFVDPADTSNTSILDNVATFLRYSGVFYPVLGVLFVLRNSLQGLGYSLVTMLAGVCELFARAFVAFFFVTTIGYTAVCIASPVAWCAAVVMLVITYAVKLHGLKKYGIAGRKHSRARETA